MTGQLIQFAKVEARHLFYYPPSGRRAGEAQLHSDGGIWAVEIYAEFRGRGYGRALMVMLLAEARELGHRSVWLFVHESNTVACRLYESLGFLIRSRGVRGLLMELRLDR